MKSVNKYTKKAAKTREIVIENGKEKTVDENTVNSANVSQTHYKNPRIKRYTNRSLWEKIVFLLLQIIDLPRYEHLIQNVDGEIKYEISSNGSYLTAFNYLLSNPSNDGEKNIQILDGTLSVSSLINNKIVNLIITSII